MKTVAEIAEELNAQAASLAPDLLPNGHASGNFWMASGIDDTGQSASLGVHIRGSSIGHWRDYGNCGAGEERGDMLDLLRLVRGFDAKGAIAEAKRLLGIEDRWTPNAPRPDPAEQARRAEAVRERAAKRQAEEEAHRALRIRRAKGLFLSGRDIAGTPAEAYLLNRRLTREPFDTWPGALRFHPEVWCKAERCKVPGMLAAVYNADGQQIAVHRTFLTHDAKRGWVKIDSPDAKWTWGPMWGGFVPISKGASGKSMRSMPLEPVYVTEGIENAIVVRMKKPDARVVAAISLPNIGGIVLPPVPDGEKRQMVVVCDRDEKPKAQEALERAIARQQARGVEVSIVMPPAGINDFNEWLIAVETGRKSA